MSEGGTDRVEVAIEGLEVFGRHGVLDAERELGQRFVVDVRLELAGCPGAATDRLEDTVDYARLADEIVLVADGKAHEPEDAQAMLADPPPAPAAVGGDHPRGSARAPS